MKLRRPMACMYCTWIVFMIRGRSGIISSIREFFVGLLFSLWNFNLDEELAHRPTMSDNDSVRRGKLYLCIN